MILLEAGNLSKGEKSLQCYGFLVSLLSIKSRIKNGFVFHLFYVSFIRVCNHWKNFIQLYIKH